MEFAADLSPRQLASLSKGRKVRISHKMMGHGTGFAVSPATHAKLTRAYARQKGADVQLSADEIDANGGRIGHSGVNRSKKAGKWLGTLGGIAKSVGKFVKPAAVPIREAVVNRAVAQIDPATAMQNSFESTATTLSPFFQKKQIAGPQNAVPLQDWNAYNEANGTNIGYQTRAGLAQAYATAYQPYSADAIAPQTSAYNIDSYKPVYQYEGLTSMYGQGLKKTPSRAKDLVGARGQPVFGSIQARASQPEMTSFTAQLPPRFKGAGLYL